MMGARPGIPATSFFGRDSFSKVISTLQPRAAVTQGEAEIREIRTKHSQTQNKTHTSIQTKMQTLFTLISKWSQSRNLVYFRSLQFMAPTIKYLHAPTILKSETRSPCEITNKMATMSGVVTCPPTHQFDTLRSVYQWEIRTSLNFAILARMLIYNIKGRGAEKWHLGDSKTNHLPQHHCSTGENGRSPPTTWHLSLRQPLHSSLSLFLSLSPTITLRHFCTCNQHVVSSHSPSLPYSYSLPYSTYPTHFSLHHFSSYSLSLLLTPFSLLLHFTLETRRSSPTRLCSITVHTRVTPRWMSRRRFRLLAACETATSRRQNKQKSEFHTLR